MSGVGAQLHHLATRHGRPRVADRLTYLFGRAACPACGAEFSVADAVAASDQQ